MRHAGAKSKTLIYIIDLSAEELADGLCDFKYMEDQFPDQIEAVGVGGVENVLSTLYRTMADCAENGAQSEERVFLLLFGINRARRLRIGNIYDETGSGELTALDMLQKILERGNSFISTQSCGARICAIS